MKENLNCCNPNIDNASGDAGKEDKTKETLQWKKTPQEAQKNAKDLGNTNQKQKKCDLKFQESETDKYDHVKQSLNGTWRPQ